jgi:hypothetical protein
MCPPRLDVRYVQGKSMADNSEWIAQGETDFDVNMGSMHLKSIRCRCADKGVDWRSLDNSDWIAQGETDFDVNMGSMHLKSIRCRCADKGVDWRSLRVLRANRQ